MRACVCVCVAHHISIKIRVVCSKFEDNNGGSGAIIDFSFQSGVFNDNVFINNVGSVVRVSLVSDLMYKYKICSRS